MEWEVCGNHTTSEQGDREENFPRILNVLRQIRLKKKYGHQSSLSRILFHAHGIATERAGSSGKAYLLFGGLPIRISTGKSSVLRFFLWFFNILIWSGLASYTFFSNLLSCRHFML